MKLSNDAEVELKELKKELERIGNVEEVQREIVEKSRTRSIN